MITKRTGHGQTICKGCKEKGKFGLNWDSFLYNFNDEPYCFECLMEMLEIYQDRINKAIEYNNQIIKDTKSFYRPTEDTIYSGDTLIELAERNIEILKGDNNEC